VLAALEDVLPACLPGPDGFATEDFILDRIVVAAVARAAALDRQDPAFAKGGIGYQLLRTLLIGSITALEHDPEFRQLLQLSGLRELLRRHRQSEEGAERRQLELLEAIARAKGVEIAPLRVILAKLGESGVPDYEITVRLATAADELIELRKQLARLTNDRPEFALIRSQALAQIDRGEFDAAGAALGRGREAARAIREDASRNEAEFLAAEARIDHLQLNYRAAAEKYSQAAALVTSFDRNIEWGYLVQQANELYTQGMEFGEKQALLDAIDVYDAALPLVLRTGVPLDWAMTQNNFGVALQTLGERESGMARLEEAVEAYRVALQERTRERVPLDWAATQNNLGIALMRLGERDGGTAHLTEAVAAYRAALQELTRERVPLDWAKTQTNLGAALHAKLAQIPTLLARTALGIIFCTGAVSTGLVWWLIAR
jgi:tetratricopeptide (TPR) repeat protein